jgi:hypothetical protein
MLVGLNKKFAGLIENILLYKIIFSLVGTATKLHHHIKKDLNII